MIQTSILMFRLTRRLVQARIASRAEIHGCALNEIAEIRSVAGSPLPQAYESFLRRMGRGAGGFLRGSDVFYPDLLTNKAAAAELLLEDHAPFELSSSDFVFFVHQGYQFMLFHLNESEDPPVFCYIEGGGLLERKFDHFSGFLEQTIDDQIRLGLR